MASLTALRDLIKNPGAAELELVARYAMLPEDPRRERVFEAFAASGLPHRRMEAWKWSDFKRALEALESPKSGAADDPLKRDEALTFQFTPSGFDYPDVLPSGIRMLANPDVLALGGAEEMPMGALAAALAGRKSSPGTLMIEISEAGTPPIHLQFSGHGEGNFNRIAFVIRPGAALTLSESHLGGANDKGNAVKVALAAALAGRKSSPGTLMIEISEAGTPPIHLQFSGHGEGNFNRIAFVIRPGAALNLSESHLGGAGLSSALIEFDVHTQIQRWAGQRRCRWERSLLRSQAVNPAPAH